MTNTLCSTLTFNASTANVTIHNLDTIDDYFQIMPSPRARLTPTTINNFTVKNPRILIHVNYLTHVFANDTIEYNSPARKSLAAYNVLARHIGTNNVLIHLPYSTNEMNRLADGIQVIHDELVKYGKTIHLEMPAFTAEFQRTIRLRERSAVECLNEYFERIFDELKQLPEGSFKLVFDTAHMYSNGCTGKDMIELMEKYKPFIEYVHLNGNEHSMYAQDKHCPIYSDRNKIPDVDELSTYCAQNGFVCVCEVTGTTGTWDGWTSYANKYGFRLVQYNSNLGI